MKSAELLEPEFKTKGFFTVKLYRPIRFSKWLNNLDIEITKIQENILTAINNNSKITYKEIGEKAGVGKSTINKNIQILKDLNLVERIGESRSGIWKINTKI